MKIYHGKRFFRENDFPLDVSYSKQRSFMEPHIHDFIEIALVAQGHTIHTIRSESGQLLSCSLIQGDLVAVMPGEEHSYANSKNLVIYNLMFYPALIASDMVEIHSMNIGKHLFEPHPHSFRKKLHLPINKLLLAEKYLKRVMSVLSMRPPGFHLQAKTDFLEFLLLANESVPIPWPVESDIKNSMLEILNQLENEPEKPFNLKKLAEKSRMSVSAFTRQFREMTGDSPLNYCMGLRLDKVRDQLCNSNLSISEIAYQNGFCDGTYLVKRFRLRFGITPLRYRKLIKQP